MHEGSAVGDIYHNTESSNRDIMSQIEIRKKNEMNEINKKKNTKDNSLLICQKENLCVQDGAQQCIT